MKPKQIVPPCFLTLMAINSASKIQNSFFSLSSLTQIAVTLRRKIIEFIHMNFKAEGQSVNTFFVAYFHLCVGLSLKGTGSRGVTA